MASNAAKTAAPEAPAVEKAPEKALYRNITNIPQGFLHGGHTIVVQPGCTVELTEQEAQPLTYVLRKVVIAEDGKVLS